MAGTQLRDANWSIDQKTSGSVSEKCNFTMETVWVGCFSREDPKTEVLEDARDRQGHYGEHETERRLRRFAYWPELALVVRQHVKTCLRCQQHAYKYSSTKHRNLTWMKFNEGVALDFIGPMPADGRRRYILAAVDLCTRFPMLKGCVEASRDSVVALLTQWSQLFGFPDFIVT